MSDTTTATWNGAPTVLQVNDAVALPQTTGGTVLLAARNLSFDVGALAVVAGGRAPVEVTLQPGAFWIEAVSTPVQVANVSSSAGTAIEVEAIGPGIPGRSTVHLEAGGQVRLGADDVAEGSATPGEVLTMQVNDATATVVGVVGPAGTTGDNAMAILLNAPDGPPPAGFYASTPANRYSLPLSWTGPFCVGPLLSQPISVALAES